MFFPCKNGTGILAGSCQDPAKIPAGIPPRFWPPGFPVPAGILTGNLGGKAGFPAAKISAGSRQESCRDSWRETGFPAAKISAGSRWESCRDSWREAGSRRPKSRQDPGGSLAGILGGQPDISVGVLPGFVAGNKIPCGQNLPGSQNLRGSCLESCQDSR